jgi:hypothetical protein
VGTSLGFSVVVDAPADLALVRWAVVSAALAMLITSR